MRAPVAIDTTLNSFHFWLVLMKHLKDARASSVTFETVGSNCESKE